MSEKEITFKEFEEGFSKLIDQTVGFTESNGYTLDLFFGKLNPEKRGDTSDLSLFITGNWEILLNGQAILANNGDYDKEDIAIDCSILLNQKLVSIKFFEADTEVFFEFENKYFVHVSPNSDGGWVELLQKNGYLYTQKDTTDYWLINYRIENE